MPIEVHCPNPTCAKVHQVKDKYAGMRGKCPVCQSWMYIPRPALIPTPAVEKPSRPAPDEATDWSPLPARQPTAARKSMASVPALDESEALPDEPAMLPEEPEPPRKKRVLPIEEEDEPAEMAEEEDEAPAKPKKHFSVLAVLLLLLANLGLVAFGIAPFLPGPELTASGSFANLDKPKSMTQEQMQIIWVGAGSVGLFGLLTLLVSLVRRKMGLLSLFLLYLSAIGSAGLLFLSATSLWKEAGPKGTIPQLEKDIAELKAKGETGEAVVSLGFQHYALAGGAATASLCLTLAGLFMHRRLWSRMLGFLFLAVWPALALVWVFRVELGIDGSLPFEIPGL